MSGPPQRGREVRNLTLRGARGDWRWRHKIRSNPLSRLIYRIAVAILGLVIVVVGLVLVPFPGPGWLVVFFGLGIWASEFRWAQWLRRRAEGMLKAWTQWVRPQPWWIQGLVLLATIAAVLLVFWVLFVISGVPGYLPDTFQEWLHQVPGLPR
jgi:uncharacterized protein (TIGR02611 family)